MNNPDLDAQIREKGYVIVPMLTPEEVNELKTQLDAMRPNDNFNPQGGTRLNNSTYHCTFLDTNLAYKKQVDGLLRKIFMPHINHYLHNYQLLVGNFYLKQPGKGLFEIHQNWPTAPMHETTLTLWCPLQDINDKNGGIQIIEGSHKIAPDIAAVNCDTFFKNIEDTLIKEYFTPLFPKAGECIIFDDGLLHYSDVNVSEQPRIAIQIETLPADCTPWLYYMSKEEPEKGFEIFEINTDYYLNNTMPAFINRPTTLKSLGFLPNPNRILTASNFAELMKKGPETRWEVYNSPSPMPKPLAANNTPEHKKSLWQKLFG